MTHIPYKGSAPAVTDLIAGQTHILIDVGSVLTPQIKAGKLKAIAVTSPMRDPELPRANRVTPISRLRVGRASLGRPECPDHGPGRE
jgi:hypothetical protein